MSWLQRRGVRGGLVAAAAVVAVAGTLVVAYELALARVPERRASLERLVRAQTGLDVRFNELGLRWGWYGPEAVFRRVELGEPGRSNVLLRAPQLIVGFNAWQSLQSGQLAAGRITLVAPDIDLERLTHGERPSEPTTRSGAPPSSPSVSAADASRARLLKLWRGGRIEIEGGTLRLPDPNGSSNPLIVQVRRAALRRTDNEWNGYGLVFLPERLGRAARVTAQLLGDPNDPRTLSGGLRFEGMRLSFANWREVLRDRPLLASNLPTAGAGDLTVQLTLKNGRIEKANGTVKAADLAFGAPTWTTVAHATPLKLDYLAGDWRFVSRSTGGGQLQIDELVLNRANKDAPAPRLSMDFSSGHVHGSIARAPLGSAAAIAHWLSPTVLPTGVELSGSAEDIEFDWNDARPEGFKLAASGRTSEASIASISGSFALSGLRTHLTGSESRVAIELEAPAARLDLETTTEPLTDIKLASMLQITRTDDGWRLASDDLSVHYDGGKLTLSGALTGAVSGGMPTLEARGTLSYPNVATLHTVLANGAAEALGPAVSRLTAGRIEDAKFELAGPVDELFAVSQAVRGSASLGMPVRSADSFKGSLTLKDAQFAAADAWPEMRGVAAKIDWVGPRVRASINDGTAGAFDLDRVQVQWDVSGARESRMTGRVRGHVAEALAWARSHPELQAYAPQLRDVRASGEALFNFEITSPGTAVRAARGTSLRPYSHVAALLEGVDVSLAPGLPPIESLRGSLAFDDGRLQRSTLTGIWQNLPVTLKVAERRDVAGAISVQAQGVADAEQLVAISQFHAIADVKGEAVWDGEFLYTPDSETQAAHWQGRIDSSMVGIESALPAPLEKAANATLPLHVELFGSEGEGTVRAKLGDHVRSTFALRPTGRGRAWEIEHGALEFGTGAGTLVAFLRAEDDGMSLRVQSQAVGLITGKLTSAGPDTTVQNVQWSKETMLGEGQLQCAPRLASCTAQFKISTDSAARALADIGFRPDIAAASGSMSGELTWQPHAPRSWLETASGHVSLRLADGIARTAVNTSGEPFPLLTVPALLTAMSRPGPEAMSSGELRFRSLSADFEIHDGDAFTSNLHFDGDAEILIRGRTGLLARDYDHEAWVLRGEERIPSSLRRLAATPRVAAAWIALRELVGADSAERSRVVLHLQGSWSDPVVAID